MRGKGSASRGGSGREARKTHVGGEKSFWQRRDATKGKMFSPRGERFTVNIRDWAYRFGKKEGPIKGGKMKRLSWWNNFFSGGK